jgi:hypothetical protein
MPEMSNWPTFKNTAGTSMSNSYSPILSVLHVSWGSAAVDARTNTELEVRLRQTQLWLSGVCEDDRCKRKASKIVTVNDGGP